MIKLRLSDENKAALVEGIDCHVTHMRIAKGVDEVYELYLEFVGQPPLPDHSEHPFVPLA